MHRITFKFSSMVGNFLKFTCLKWSELPLNCTPWLEKNLKFTCLKWLKMQLNMVDIMVGERFKMYLSQIVTKIWHKKVRITQSRVEICQNHASKYAKITHHARKSKILSRDHAQKNGQLRNHAQKMANHAITHDKTAHYAITQSAGGAS